MAEQLCMPLEEPTTPSAARSIAGPCAPADREQRPPGSLWPAAGRLIPGLPRPRGKCCCGQLGSPRSVCASRWPRSSKTSPLPALSAPAPSSIVSSWLSRCHWWSGPSRHSPSSVTFLPTLVECGQHSGDAAAKILIRVMLTRVVVGFLLVAGRSVWRPPGCCRWWPGF